MKLDKRKPPDGGWTTVTALVCPHCGGTNVGYWSASMPSGSYECYDCGYKGGFIIKRQAKVHEDGRTEDMGWEATLED